MESVGACDPARPFESLNGGQQFSLPEKERVTFGVYEKEDSPVGHPKLICNAVYEAGKVTFTKHLGAHERAFYLRGPDEIREEVVNGQVKVQTLPRYHVIEKTKACTTGADLVSVPMPKTMPIFKSNGYRQPEPGEACVMFVSRQKDAGTKVAYGNVTNDIGDHWGHTCPSVIGDCGSGIWALRDGKLIGFHQLGSGSDKINGFIAVSPQWAELCQGTVPKRVAHLNS
jgi:hypothetical protein